ncbi:hypothetical protein BT67DRAFT_158422 [Trichocladium antarcticum]|uniref:Uncharacterized protein n=1 Tax=Trichocladium antarcticum TaxID=1450529 RepID=A0AAN6UEX5_9PEZI|nr:hypothetical protein BT67DRAFT_158422 [Trichocladium antarcticum]
MKFTSLLVAALASLARSTGPVAKPKEVDTHRVFTQRDGNACKIVNGKTVNCHRWERQLVCTSAVRRNVLPTNLSQAAGTDSPSETSLKLVMSTVTIPTTNALLVCSLAISCMSLSAAGLTSICSQAGQMLARDRKRRCKTCSRASLSLIKRVHCAMSTKTSASAPVVY